MGAQVSAVCSTRNLELVKSLGADHVIDYTKQDFTQSGTQYDLILDNVGTAALLDLKRALKPTGIAVLIGGGGPDAGNWIGPLARPVKALFLNPFTHPQFASLLADVVGPDLDVLKQLFEAGQLRSVIDRRYTLAETPEAIRYLETGRARGKLVVTVGSVATKNRSTHSAR